MDANLLDIIVGVVVAVALILWRRPPTEIDDVDQPISDQQFLDKLVISVDVEEHDGQLFVYNSKTKEFMAQGATMPVVDSRLRARYPNCIFVTESQP